MVCVVGGVQDFSKNAFANRGLLELLKWATVSLGSVHKCLVGWTPNPL